MENVSPPQKPWIVIPKIMNWFWPQALLSKEGPKRNFAVVAAVTVVVDKVVVVLVVEKWVKSVPNGTKLVW